MRTPLTSRALHRRMAGAGLMRRPARGGGANRSAALPSILGGTGYNTASQQGTATGLGIRGDATTGVHVSALVRFTAVPSTNQIIACCLNSSPLRGWGIRALSNLLTFASSDGASQYVSPAYTITASNINKEHRIDGMWDPTGFCRLYVDGVQVGAGTAQATYSPAPATERTRIGLFFNATLPFTDGRIYALAGGNTVPSGAAIAAAYAADQVAGNLTAVAGDLNMWRIGDDAVPPTYPNTLTDQIGSDDMTTFAGATPATLATTSPIVWG